MDDGGQLLGRQAFQADGLEDCVEVRRRGRAVTKSQRSLIKTYYFVGREIAIFAK
jgi:hypothetical protein